MNLRDLVDSIELPPTSVATRAWEKAQSRSRRRTAFAVGLGAGAVAGVVAGVMALGTGGDDARPPTARSIGIPITRPNWGALASQELLRPPADATPLSDRPVQHAAVVVPDTRDKTSGFVLGDDGGWRRLDVPGLVPLPDHGNEALSVVQYAGLDAEATRLAIPQPDGLTVVDLTTDAVEHYSVQGPENHSATWEDASHVLVCAEGQSTCALVDVETGTTRTSTHGPATRALADGSALTWGGGPGKSRYRDSGLVWDSGQSVASPVNNAGGFVWRPPLARDGVAVGLHRRSAAMAGASGSTGDTRLDDLLFTSNGVGAVDSATGEVLGFLALGPNLGERTSLLGWQGDVPVLGLVHLDTDAAPPDGEPPMDVVAWEYKNGRVTPIARFDTSYLTWGVGM